jgi:protein-disulfide isomerase
MPPVRGGHRYSIDMGIRHPSAFLSVLLGAVLLSPLGPSSAAQSPRAPSRAGAPTPPANPADSARSARLAKADLGRIRGNAAAKVWLVVMSDFECPYCKTWHDETAPEIERKYVATGKVRIAYLNYIAVPSHRNAPAAHEAAMCASEQARFWPMADAIFGAQGQWKARRDAPVFFDSLAVRLRLDVRAFRACVAEGAMRPLIAADQDRVVRLGVGATPAFLVGGQRIIGAQPYPVFERAIEDALARAAARPAP